MNEKKESFFIEEEEYKKMKQKLGKKDDYFDREELQIFTEKVGAILVQFV